jgi:hypothetical protein
MTTAVSIGLTTSQMRLSCCGGAMQRPTRCGWTAAEPAPATSGTATCASRGSQLAGSTGLPRAVPTPASHRTTVAWSARRPWPPAAWSRSSTEPAAAVWPTSARTAHAVHMGAKVRARNQSMPGVYERVLRHTSAAPAPCAVCSLTRSAAGSAARSGAAAPPPPLAPMATQPRAAPGPWQPGLDTLQGATGSQLPALPPPLPTSAQDAGAYARVTAPAAQPFLLRDAALSLSLTPLRRGLATDDGRPACAGFLAGSALGSDADYIELEMFPGRHAETRAMRSS